jgi:phosphoribosylformylglycinamidine synthase
MSPKVAIIYTEGLNRDQESAYAFKTAGAQTELVHLIEIQNKEKKLSDYEILFFIGGFSYGDDIASGKIMAAKSLAYFEDQLKEFIKKDKLIIGVCNGFQYLTRVGLLPFKNIGKMETVLTWNDSNHFEARWINLRIEKSNCIFTKGMEDKIIRTPTAHGEGKFLTSPEILEKIEKTKQVVFRYVNDKGNPTMEYPFNPNGALNSIGGICSEDGKILGLMPHPECNVKWNHHPDWNDEAKKGGECLEIFKNAVKYFE